jgi:hypothetical protein
MDELHHYDEMQVLDEESEVFHCDDEQIQNQIDQYQIL